MKFFKEFLKESNTNFEYERALTSARTKINNMLIKKGLDGNGRFPTLTAIQSVVGECLTPYGFFVDFSDMMTAKEADHKAFPIMYSAKEGNYKIQQRALSLQWELRNPNDNAPKKWAAIAYVS